MAAAAAANDDDGALHPSLAQCALVAAALKLLLIPAYRSTDFEVHRNWLALTHSLPVRQWYYEAARLVDPGMLDVGALGYDSLPTVYFQRVTVIVSEMVLLGALHAYARTAGSKRPAHAAALSVLLSPGLLIIDHVHFQYNGFLFGLLVLSMVLACRQSTLLLSGYVFAALLCFKHLYLYVAPAYFVYLLRAYCLSPQSMQSIRAFNCAKLGIGILGIFAAAFGPFVYWHQIPQLLNRLLPWDRGLTHAYWAPNVWAVYSFADRVLLYLAPRLSLVVEPSAVTSLTRGFVGDSQFAVLPSVPKQATFALTILFQTVPLVKLFLNPTWDMFVGAVTLCGFASFLFGWHVHEKAIMTVIVPFSLIALKDRRYLGAFRPLAVAGHVSLFPLLFTTMEFPIKMLYTIFWLVALLLAFDRLAPASPQPQVFLVDRFALLYTTVAIPLIAYTSLVHQLIFGTRLEFLPLMFTSAYCAVGVIGSWLGFLNVYMTS